jgi:hypothetical protein
VAASSAYSGLAAMSSACVPAAWMRPESITMIRSAMVTVDRRCATAEVASMLGTSTTAVKSTLQRARARLKALRADAEFEMVGTRTWFSGRATCLRYLAHVIESPGDWQMAPTLANGQPAAIACYRDSAYGLGILTATPAGIARITVFGGDPDLAAKFGFPPVTRVVLPRLGGCGRGKPRWRS